MGFPRQESWSGAPSPAPSPEDLPDSRIEPASHAFAGRFFTIESPGKPPCKEYTKEIHVEKTRRSCDYGGRDQCEAVTSPGI